MESFIVLYDRRSGAVSHARPQDEVPKGKVIIAASDGKEVLHLWPKIDFLVGDMILQFEVERVVNSFINHEIADEV